LPSEYKFLPDDADTGAVACNGVVYVAKRTYSGTPGGRAIIGRSRLTALSTMHWPADRVKVVTVGNREAVLLEPVFPEFNEFGGTQTQVIFPEPFGHSFIFTENIDLTDVMALAEIVAEATQ
jgi:hypothetical protein